MASDAPAHRSPATWLVSGGRPAGDGESMNVPPVLGSNVRGSHDYARSQGTPTWEAFEDVLGGLEGGSAVAFGSGMAAVAAVFDLLSTDAHVVIPTDCYHGVAMLADDGARAGRWTLDRLPVTDTAAWVDAVESAALVWLESPTNPLLAIAELGAVCGHPRSPDTLVVVDNTFATPLAQRPLALGADLVVHSASKFLGGHSDLVMGAVVGSADDTMERIRRRRTLGGAVPGALEAFLATRGLRTLHVRLERSQRSAAELAERLAGHAAVETVRYAGLPDHPGHDIARRELDGFGSVISFDVVGGADAADAVVSALTLVVAATSLGGVETTIERRNALIGQEDVPPGLLRMAVGIEDVDDLWRDLREALDRA